MRHDEDDTYLVVAADKGTATFSDIANEVAESYDFWLGDAFASGGSAGYDHKKMGITARGAWESVKRHFRELGVNTQTQDFTVVGVGDMSGDVFGNGMLLSEHIRLVAAFDHRHIFIDPNPDAETSYAERRRLFELPRSSWADYDTELISAGGGVFPRSAKAIPVNAHIREALGIESNVAKMTPADLMRAILQAPVDLLWNGGIGTYVKSSAESHAEVGDKANDAIRVDGADLRVKVVGEGGNLGLTQLGRIEFAQHGGKINTDAIDNSAGVDTSDHEVNIKILLNAVVANGDLTVKQRNKLLAEMTDEVGALVLRNNYAQNTAIANALAQSPSMLHAQQRFLRHLVREGYLDRALEFLPTERQIRERLNAYQGLTGPETAVLLAYTKITVSVELLATSLPDDPYLQSLLLAYFPTALRDQFREQIEGHALSREIVTTVLVNDTVNTGGTSFLHRLREETGASLEEIVRAQTAARAIFNSSAVWDAVEALDNVVAADVQTRIRLHSRRLVERGTRWLLNNRPQPLQLAETISFFTDGVEQVWSELPKLVRGADLEWYQQIYDELSDSRRAGRTRHPRGRVLLRLPGAGHRLGGRPHGPGPDGRRRGLLRPRRPSRHHPAHGPHHRAAACRPLAVHGPRVDPRGLVRGPRGADRRRPGGGQRGLHSRAALRGLGGEERGDPRAGPHHPGRDPGLGLVRPRQPVGGDADDADPAALAFLSGTRTGAPRAGDGSGRPRFRVREARPGFLACLRCFSDEISARDLPIPGK